MAETVFTLPEPLVSFVEDQVKSGAYRDRDAVVADALARMRDQAAEDDEVKLARLNARLQIAIDELERGEGIEITDLDAHFDEVEARVLETVRSETRRS